MAKEKKTQEPDTNEVIDQLQETVRKQEELLLALQPELWRFRGILIANHSKAGTSANDLYQEVRDILGDKGQALDRKLRGVE
jgi:hypothetical protein